MQNDFIINDEEQQTLYSVVYFT